MDRSVTNRFIIPIGLGSSVALILSAFDGDNFSLLKDNNTYHWLIAIICLISCMYFTIDFILMIILYKPSYNVYFIHHLIGIIGIYLVYMDYYYLVKYLLAYLTYEVSTIFLNISAVYRRSNTINYFSRTSDLLFLITYTIIRILFGTYLLFDILILFSSFGTPTAYIVIIPLALQILNYWWYYKIICMIQKNNNMNQKQ